MRKNCPVLEKSNTLQNQEEAQGFLRPFSRGDCCPKCGQGALDYDGVLNLTCSHCGYTNSTGGSFT